MENKLRSNSKIGARQHKLKTICVLYTNTLKNRVFLDLYLAVFRLDKNKSLAFYIYRSIWSKVSFTL